MANAIDIEINLVDKNFSFESTGGLNLPVNISVTPPGGNGVSIATITAHNSSVYYNFPSSWLNDNNGLERGDWIFAYTPDTGDDGKVTFHFGDSAFSSSSIENDVAGVVEVTDSIISTSSSMTLDCTSSELTIVDNTTYAINSINPIWQPISVYSNTIYSPPNQTNIDFNGIASVSFDGGSAGTNKIISPIYAGVYTNYITGIGIWEFPSTNSLVTDSIGNTSNVTVRSEIDGGTQLEVECTGSSIAEIWPCIKEQNEKYENASCVNETLAKKERKKLKRALQLLTLVEQSNNCGESNLVSGYIDEIKTTTNCTSCS